MFQRDKSFMPDFDPAIIDAVHRRARRERSKAFRDLFWATASKPEAQPVTVGAGLTAKPC